MAAGDTKQALTSIAAGAFLDIKPASGDEYVIHNIHHEAGAELYFSDGTNQVKIATDSAEGSWLGLQIHVTNSIYLRVKNTDGAAKYLGYDGVETK